MNEGKHALPPGWSSTPSAWSERRWLLGLAAVGLCAAVCISLYQLGLVPALWDPVFGAHSSYLVTHSRISRLLPFPDGLLGIPGYLCDLVFGSIGGAERWREKPWAVLAFSLVITGLALVSLLLTIAMGVMVHAYCFVCLVSASCSALIFGLGIGEVLPTLQHLARVRARAGNWHAVWSAVWGQSARATHRTERDQRREHSLRGAVQ